MLKNKLFKTVEVEAHRSYFFELKFEDDYAIF